MDRTHTTRIGIGLLAVIGCSGADAGDSADMIGEATFALAAAPADASCLQVVVAGSRTVTRLIDLMPGQSTVFSLNGLPLGNDTFTESAFAQPCGMLPSSAVPTWASDPTAATLQAGVTASVTVVLRRNGMANVTSDFQDDTPACMPPLQLCTTMGMSACTDVTSNPLNCGMCGNVCQPFPNSIPACNSGMCILLCNVGFENCNMIRGDGCETNIFSDVNNCGGCGQRCPPVPRAQPVCQSGFCDFICNPGSFDCNGDPADGCESSSPLCP